MVPGAGRVEAHLLAFQVLERGDVGPHQHVQVGDVHAGDVLNLALDVGIGKHLPGTPTVVVQNMPGAGGLQQMNNLGSIAPKDGSSIGMINPMMTVAPILTPDFAKYDPSRFSWIGSVNTEIGTCTFWPASKLSSVEQLKQRRVKMGGIGAAGGSTLDATTLREVLGFSFDIVLGYPGMTEATLAAERGEVDGVCGLNGSRLEGNPLGGLQAR